MNKFSFILAPIIISFVALPSYAAIIERTFPWDSKANRAAVIYKSDEVGNLKSFTSRISHSKSGEQRLYFEVDYDIEKPVSQDIDPLYDIEFALSRNTSFSTTMVFNGQAIKMLGFSEKYSSSNSSYSSYSPETTKGHAYVVNLFKESTSPIKIEFRGDTLYIPVIGFTKIWNNKGGNAI